MFDFSKFLREHFQTPQGLLSFLAAYNAPQPSDHAVIKWFQRKQIPADWFAVLLAWLEVEHGEPVRLANFLSKEKKHAGKSNPNHGSRA